MATMALNDLWVGGYAAMMADLWGGDSLYYGGIGWIRGFLSLLLGWSLNGMNYGRC